MPRDFSWADFEKIMIKIHKIKSHVFEDGESVTVGDVHRGAFMHRNTERIRFINHHLYDDIAAYKIEAQTKPSNEQTWVIKTNRSGEVDIRKHNHIVQNAASASAANAVLTLDSDIPRSEVQQYKNVQKRLINSKEEHEKSAGPNDIFARFCTSTIPGLCNDGTYDVPQGSILVAKENWDEYFGPYAGRSYVFAREVEGNGEVK